MLYNLQDQTQTAKLRERLEFLIQRGAWVELTERSAKTSNQNRYLHACFGYLGAQLGYTREYVKREFFKKMANAAIFSIERTDRDGRKYMDLRSTSDLTKEETATAIDRFRNWAVTETGVYIPSPEDVAAVNYMEQIAERDRAFL